MPIPRALALLACTVSLILPFSLRAEDANPLKSGRYVLITQEANYASDPVIVNITEKDGHFSLAAEDPHYTESSITTDGATVIFRFTYKDGKGDPNPGGLDGMDSLKATLLTFAGIKSETVAGGISGVRSDVSYYYHGGEPLSATGRFLLFPIGSAK